MSAEKEMSGAVGRIAALEDMVATLISMLQAEPTLHIDYRSLLPLRQTPASQERATPSPTLAEQSSARLSAPPSTHPRHEENNNE